MFSTTAIYRRAATNVLRSPSKVQNATVLPQQQLQVVRTFANDPTFGGSATPFYSPTLTNKRAGEAGRGGRSSEAGCKVAVFGGSGFLGGFLCAELGKYMNTRDIHLRSRSRPSFNLLSSRSLKILYLIYFKIFNVSFI